MDVKELRIGNYVSDIHASDSFYAKVRKLDYDRCYYGQYHSAYSDLRPIPLTKQWLLDFGFEFNMEDEAYQGKRLHIEVRNNDECLTKKNKELLKDSFGVWLFCTNSFLCEIKYVHQLQNLYFVLTGEELTKK